MEAGFAFLGGDIKPIQGPWLLLGPGSRDRLGMFWFWLRIFRGKVTGGGPVGVRMDLTREERFFRVKRPDFRFRRRSLVQRPVKQSFEKCDELFQYRALYSGCGYQYCPYVKNRQAVGYEVT